MHRTDADGNDSNLFTNGDPGLGDPATVVEEDWLNAVQEEICNVIEDAGITLVKGTNTQLSSAIQAMLAAFTAQGHTWGGVQAFVDVAASALAIVNVSGNGSFPPLSCDCSGTAAPFHIEPKAAPSSLANGDIWVETGTNTLKVRINGVTKTVTLT